jgi:D-glycero-D-manno-heptose 1,7-bisphosphate phosphatase
MTCVSRGAVSIEAVFLDRDGVINENRQDHVKSWQEFRFLPGVLDAIACVSRAGVRVFVVTNQAVVSRGLVSAEMISAINQRMIDEIEFHGGRIEEVALCSHQPEEACECRKPRPGLLLSLAHKHGVNLEAAVVIGDALSDIDAAHAAGCAGILVLTGRGRDQLVLAGADAEFLIADDLGAAARLVLEYAAPCE